VAFWCNLMLKAMSGDDATTPKVGTGVSRSVVINAASCANLLSNTVFQTSGYNIDRLLRLHHQMSLAIYEHRHDYDKTALLKVNFSLCFLIILTVY